MNKLRKTLFLFIAVIAVNTAFSQTIPKWKVADLEQYIKTVDKPTVINFWATFCKPCIEEMPYFQEMQKKYKSKGLELILVNLDVSAAYPKLIKAFAVKRKITAPIVFLDETNADLFCPVVDEKWSGAIPATLLLNGNGYRKFIEDQLSKKQLETEIKAMLSKRNIKKPV